MNRTNIVEHEILEIHTGLKMFGTGLEGFGPSATDCSVRIYRRGAGQSESRVFWEVCSGIGESAVRMIRRKPNSFNGVFQSSFYVAKP
ncbi:predicted protein [Arabidopsis lyrata subsp. lyrata]|uniref:Predicted protein n=1 Tax=Arabidopsis lyrata subsp. lyrata TaxID=81972 RepID=D7LNY9_ARALL|nr:predicted protein [Arabidopsis lyrata subsp. lyrata]